MKCFSCTKSALEGDVLCEVCRYRHGVNKWKHQPLLEYAYRDAMRRLQRIGG